MGQITYIITLMILSTIAMISAFLLPEDIGKWIIILTVFIAVGIFYARDRKKVKTDEQKDNPEDKDGS